MVDLRNMYVVCRFYVHGIVYIVCIFDAAMFFAELLSSFFAGVIKIGIRRLLLFLFPYSCFIRTLLCVCVFFAHGVCG